MGKARALLVTAAVLVTSSATLAAPSWWSNALNEARTTNDFAAVNQGQVKWFALQARDYLDATLPALGGAGTTLDALIDSQSPSNNYLAVNQGQLKALVAPFYDRLVVLGYASGYPWTAAPSDDLDYAAANVGQVKRLFDFDLGADSDLDGLPDQWELGTLGTTSTDGTGDRDGDGYLDIYEFAYATSATNGGVFPTPTLIVDPADTNTPATLQAALDGATNAYAIVLAADATYAGPSNRNLRFPDHPVMLTSSNGPTGCVLEVDGAGRGVAFDGDQTRATVLSGFTIRGGATNVGGAIACIGSSPTIRDCIMTENAATEDGGALDLDGGQARLVGCLISNNVAQTHGGGGISCWNGASPLIENTVIAHNTAVYGGGLYAYGIVLLESNLFAEASQPLLRNCLFVHNAAATNGGAIYASPGAEAIIENASVFENTAGDRGGGIFAGGGLLRNAAIGFNDALAGGNIGTYGFRPELDYSCLTPTNDLRLGLGVIDADPDYDGQYRLVDYSAGIDAGTNLAWMAQATDLGGTNRVLNGTVDMGAYELVP